MALVHKASTVYSDDPDIAAHGKACGLRVLALADLPLPPSRQMNLEEVLSGEEANTHNESLSSPISGGAPGSTSGEAGTKAAEESSREGRAHDETDG